MSRSLLAAALLLAGVLTGCETMNDEPAESIATGADTLLSKYMTFRLTADLSVLSDRERQMIPLLIEAGQAMDEIYKIQAYGNLDSLIATVEDPSLRRFVEINYGPWDRLEGNAPFIAGVGPKPPGANFYPPDVTKEEFVAAAELNPNIRSLYTMVRRGSGLPLIAIPYHEFFAEPVQRASEKLRQAAQLADDPGLKRYLEMRAEALLTDDYQPSDLAWMEMKDNTIEVVIGPIETYEDQLFGYKAANETFVLIKDLEWSQRLARYAALLPALQRGLPVPDQYKRETPGTESDLGAYDAVYYAGDANAGSKTIAINLPNDEEVQLQRGTRRLQLKNAMQAKFDQILVPIAGVLIAEDQREHVTFDAFFSNTMFHEVAHGLGIKNLVSGQGTVREALREHYSGMEEGKADILGLYMVRSLQVQGEMDTDLMDNYTTFLAGIFRSVRFGSSSAHGNANMIRFNFFKERDAFTRDPESGTYQVNRQAFEQAINELSQHILQLQGDGSYEAVADFVQRYGTMDPQLQADLQRLQESGIPVDIVFEQGMSVLDLN